MVTGLPPAVILAAGFSTRMGRDKARLPIPGGGWFLSRLARTLLAAGCPEAIAVVGPLGDEIHAAAARERLPVRFVVNPDPSRGQLSSLQEALAVLVEREPRGLLMSPVDQPIVRVETVRLVIEEWSRSAAAVVRPSWRGRHGHPVLFDRRVLEDLRQADAAAGARAVVHARAGETRDVEVDDPGAFEDIDTPEDYRRVFGVALADVEASATSPPAGRPPARR
jgi:molybdenum cofactor cytidylyltransferase